MYWRGWWCRSSVRVGGLDRRSFGDEGWQGGRSRRSGGRDMMSSAVTDNGR